MIIFLCRPYRFFWIMIMIMIFLFRQYQFFWIASVLLISSVAFSQCCTQPKR